MQKNSKALTCALSKASNKSVFILDFSSNYFIYYIKVSIRSTYKEVCIFLFEIEMFIAFLCLAETH